MVTRPQIKVLERIASTEARWVIVGASGTPKLVSGASEVRDLLDQGRITADSRVHEITAAPRRLRDIPELRSVVAEPLSSEPPVRRQVHWSPERVDFSEELAILDRPLDGDVEYFDESARSRKRGIKLVFMMLLVAGVAFGAFTARTNGSLVRRVGSWIGLPAASAAPALSRHM